MPEKANVRAVEAIEAFRANLILYLAKARPTLEEVSGDVLRTRSWVENDQRTLWERELRRRTRELEQTQQELFSAKLSNLRDESATEVLAVRRAKRSLEEAEAKLRAVRHWSRDFENRVQPLVKQIEKLDTVLANDLPHGIATLAQILKTLDAYAEVAPPSAPEAEAPATSSTGNAHVGEPGRARTS